MIRKFIILLVLGLFSKVNGVSQAPIIAKVELISTFPKDRIIISGSGFNASPAQLQVWFDQARGTIISSTDFSIEVEIPAQARLANVTVLNLATRLSGMSPLKLTPTFRGETFDPLKFSTPISFSSVKAVFDLISGDIDGDNKPDLIGSKFENTATNLFFLLNQSSIGNISFTNPAPTSLDINAPTGNLSLGDLNGDGKLDLVASRSGTTANIVYVLKNTSTAGNPSFATPVLLNLDATHFARQVKINDLNGDGKPEIIVANSASNDLYIFKNESVGGTLTINPTPVKISVTGATTTLALEVQDFDLDGKADIVATQNQSNDLFILKNNSTLSSFTFAVSKITMFGTLNDLTAADFNQDGKLDIVATSVFGAQVNLLINQSTASGISFKAPILLTTDTGPFGVDVNDINGDGFADIIVPCRGANTINVFLHNQNLATLAFTKTSISTAKTNWYALAGDLDGDAKPDLAFSSFTNPSTFSVDILRNQNCHTPVILNAEPLFICPTQTIRLDAIPLPGLTFDWLKDGLSFKNSADPFADITQSGTYTVTAIGESGACSKTSAALLVQSALGSLPPNPSITDNSPVCEGQSISLSTVAVVGATYLWSGPNNFTATTQNVSISNARPIDGGTYSLIVKIGDCSSNQASTNIDVASFGSFTLSSNSTSNTICQGQSITLTVTTQAGYSSQWIKDGVDIVGQTASTLNVNTSGSYKVRVTNTGLSCSKETNQIDVTVYTPPNALYTVVPSGCLSESIVFTNTSTTDSKATPTYSWKFGDGGVSSLQNPTHSYTTAQSFATELTVSYVGITGCTATTTKNININNPINPTISATLAEICPTETSTLSIENTFTTILWSTQETTASIDITSPNTYSVSAKDANGCNGQTDKVISLRSDCAGGTNLSIPVAFTPNGDVQNDLWVIPGVENYGDCTMNVYDGRGRRVYQVKGYPVAGWDGIAEGKEVPQGTYYYVFSCPTSSPLTGSVLILR